MTRFPDGTRQMFHAECLPADDRATCAACDESINDVVVRWWLEDRAWVFHPLCERIWQEEVEKI